MIKESLSEFHSKRVSSSVSSVNGKGDAVVSSEEEKRRNGKGVRVSMVDTDKTKPVVSVEKTASSGELSMYCHVDATDWCPNGDIVAALSKFFTKPVSVKIFPRYLMPTVWSSDHCNKPYEKDYYAFRAYAGPDYCKIFVDETETKDSVLWVMLHELAHIALATSPFLFKGYRHLTPPDYFESDEAHESDPEEKMANEIAMSWMDMLGYGKVSYPRHWWRQRTFMNKKASLKGTLLGSGIGSLVGGGRELADISAANAQEDYLLNRDEKSLTPAQRLKRRAYNRKRIAAAAAKGGVLGGALGFGAGKAQRAFTEGLGDVKRLRDDTLSKAKEVGEEIVSSGKRKADEFVDSTKSKLDDSISKGIDKGKDAAEEFMDAAKVKVDDSVSKGLDKGKEVVEESMLKGKDLVEDAITRTQKGAGDTLAETLYGADAAADTTKRHPGGLVGALEDQRTEALDQMGDKIDESMSRLPRWLGGGPKPKAEPVSTDVATTPKKKGIFGFFSKKAAAHDALYRYHNSMRGIK